MVERQIKSNDLGLLLENSLKEALSNRKCVFWRLHTIRSWKGVSNPCDFIVLDKDFTALLECKATTDDKFSCASFRQLNHFEKSAQFVHKGLYGVVVYFHSVGKKFVYASDFKVLENKAARRPIRVSNPKTFDFIADSLEGLLDMLSRVNV